MFFIDFLQSLYGRFEDDDVPAMGAQLTYYLILSFFPFLIFVFAVLSYSEITVSDAMANISRVLPQLSDETMVDIFSELQKSRNGSILSIGLLATLWSASNGVNAIIKALNKAYDEEAILEGERDLAYIYHYLSYHAVPQPHIAYFRKIDR